MMMTMETLLAADDDDDDKYDDDSSSILRALARARAIGDKKNKMLRDQNIHTGRNMMMIRNA